MHNTGALITSVGQEKVSRHSSAFLPRKAEVLPRNAEVTMLGESTSAFLGSTSAFLGKNAEKRRGTFL